MELTKQGIIAEFDRRSPNAFNRRRCEVNICYSCLRQVFTDAKELKRVRTNVQQLSSCINHLACGGWKRNCYQVAIGELEGVGRGYFMDDEASN